MDREKVIKWLEELEGFLFKEYTNIITCPSELDADGHYRIDRWKELIRCKDCKHGEECNSVYLCGKSRGFGIAHDPSWFCADGERKEGR